MTTGFRTKKWMRTRQRVVDAARELVREQGLGALTYGEIARRTGMSKAGISTHFATRDELAIAVIAEWEAALFERVIVASTSERGLAQLWRACELWFTAWPSLGLPLDALAGPLGLDIHGRPTLAERMAQAIQRWHACLESAIRIAAQRGELDHRCDPRGLAFVLLSQAMTVSWTPTVFDRERATATPLKMVRWILEMAAAHPELLPGPSAVPAERVGLGDDPETEIEGRAPH